MKEYDRVELIVDRNRYTKHNVHKGMEGWICDERNLDGCWLVCFDEADDLPEYPIIAVAEVDLKVVVSHEPTAQQLEVERRYYERIRQSKTDH